MARLWAGTNSGDRNGAWSGRWPEPLWFFSMPSPYFDRSFRRVGSHTFLDVAGSAYNVCDVVFLLILPVILRRMENLIAKKIPIQLTGKPNVQKLRCVSSSRYSQNDAAFRSFSKKYGVFPMCDQAEGCEASDSKKGKARKDLYSVLFHPDLDTARPDLVDISALYVTRPARFANSLMQLENVISIARKQKIPLIILNNFWYLPKTLIELGDGISILNTDNRSKTLTVGAILAGYFFKKDPILPLLSSRGQARSEVLSVAIPHFDLKPSGHPFADDELVIHIRSGDVFQEFSESFPTSYGQPPLAFYTMVVKSRQWKKVYLVYENTANPVIAALEGYLQCAGIPFEIQSGDLRGDIEFLLRASVLVAGRGTFMPGIVTISPNARMVYSFEKTYMDWGKRLPHRRVVDRQGKYRDAVMGNNWRNSKEQCELMLSYPEEALDVESENFPNS